MLRGRGQRPRGRRRSVSGGGLDLGGSQLALLQYLRDNLPATRLVVVLLNGGPISSPWTMAHADAVLEGWYGGEEAGAALAQALFGESSPAGRMPVTTVASLDDLPPYTDFALAAPPGRTSRHFTGAPLVPFGFGLSFAEFEYAGLSVSPPALAAEDGGVNVSAVVTHAGGTSLECDEVAQLYGRFTAGGAASPPLQQLLAFERLRAIRPGQSVPVTFHVPRAAFELADSQGTLRVMPGTWTLWLGGGPPSNADFGGGAVLVGSLVVE